VETEECQGEIVRREKNLIIGDMKYHCTGGKYGG
jgi:hypothetical protein